jgi:hypothetical protein
MAQYQAMTHVHLMQLPWAEASEPERTVLGGGVLLEAWPERISPRIGQLRIGDFLSFFF